MSWPQQVGPQQPGPQQPGSQPLGPEQVRAPQPGPPQATRSGWGGTQTRYPNAVQPPPNQPPPQRVPTPPRRPPRRRRRLLVVVMVVAVLVVAGVVAGIVAGGGTKHESKTSLSASPTVSVSSAPAGGAQTTAAIARNAETVVHGLGNGKPNAFCPLIDRVDLQRLLREKHLGKCADIKLTARTNRAEYQSFRVIDPSAIQMYGDTADIPATAITPAAFGTVEMREDSDGTWKFRFYTG